MNKCVIFDLDGTITNTVPDIEDNVNKTMRKFGYPEITADEARRFVALWADNAPGAETGAQ